MSLDLSSDENETVFVSIRLPDGTFVYSNLKDFQVWKKTTTIISLVF